MVDHAASRQPLRPVDHAARCIVGALSITLPKRFFFFFFFLFFIASRGASLGARRFLQLAASPEHCRRPAPRCLEHCPAQPARDRGSAAELVPRCRAVCVSVSGIARQCRRCRALQCGASASPSMQHWSTNVALNTFEALGCATLKRITHAAYPLPPRVSGIAGARLGWLEPGQGMPRDGIASRCRALPSAFARARLGAPIACQVSKMPAPVIQHTHCPNSPNIAPRVYQQVLTLRARRYLLNKHFSISVSK